MPAPTIWIAPLVFVLAFPENIPNSTDNVFNFFPFNNPAFCKRCGIRNTTVGLSIPPEGPIGDQLKPNITAQWPDRVVGATRFLRWLFDDMKIYANEWVASRQNQLLEKRLKKGKGKAKKTDEDESDPKLDTHGIPIDKQQTEWKKNASISDFDDWH
ncbi:hypothetical protein RhiTH_009494 [Rhizoctonia solani]